MHPVNPKGDLLRSESISGHVAELIKSWREMPDVLVILLTQQPDNYEAIIKNTKARFKDEFITFSPLEVYGLKIGLCFLGFVPSSNVAVSEFFEMLSHVPFDEGGIYIRGQFHLRLLLNEELERPSG